MMETTEIAALYRELLGAWNRRNAADMASLFTPEGTTVGFDGTAHVGRATIEREIGEIFANHETATFVAILREVREIGPEVSLLRAIAGMVPPGQADLKPEVNAVQSLVAARRDGKWRIELFHNTPAAYHGRPEAGEALTEELRQRLREERGA